MTASTNAWMRRVGLVLVLSGVACRSPRAPDCLPTECEKVKMLSIMVPDRIRIEAFTKITSFNNDRIPDGILAVVRPLDRFGDPVKAGGLFYFELWTYVDASNERKGERLAFWDRTIATSEDVKLYWTRAQMYEFQLAWTGGASLQPDKKYVFTATYRSPWDTTIRDERILDFHVSPDFMTETAPAE